MSAALFFLNIGHPGRVFSDRHSTRLRTAKSSVNGGDEEGIAL